MPSPNDQRRNDLAWVGVTLSIFGPVVSYVILGMAQLSDWLATVLFFAPCLGDAVISMIAVSRILKYDRRLRGLTVAIAGAVIGCAWMTLAACMISFAG